jgi:hypothetical protein
MYGYLGVNSTGQSDHMDWQARPRTLCVRQNREVRCGLLYVAGRPQHVTLTRCSAWRSTALAGGPCIRMMQGLLFVVALLACGLPAGPLFWRVAPGGS